MSEEAGIVIILIGLIGLFIWCEVSFQESQTALYDECVADKKDKWTCRAVIEARQAGHDASIAAGVAIGSAASRR